MNIGFYSFFEYYNKNKMFLDPCSPLGDNLMYPFFYLGQNLKKQGHQVSTLDMGGKFDAVVFLEFPGLKNKYLKKLIKNKFENLYLITLESPIIRPENYDKENHKFFKKIFTWDDKVIDNKKYFKLNYCHKKPKDLLLKSKKSKLCTLIAANKFKSHASELYSERRKIIRWFEKNHAQDFDLYGFGWNRYYFHGQFLGINLLRLNRLSFLAKLLKPNYPSYKGKVKSKAETYKNYKFAICYENSKDFPGYITEKIFDCFFAGCVPIYRGASNITDHIPNNTFIDKRNFKNIDQLYNFIKNMPDNEYNNYLKAIQNFIQNDKFYEFSPEYFSQTLIKEIL